MADVAWLVFVGTQGNEPGKGIVAVRLDRLTGDLSARGPALEVPRPTWLLSDPARNRVFAVNELGNAGDCEGGVQSFSAKDGELHPISRVSSGGGGPTHLALTEDGSALFVANYGGGQAGVLPVSTDGKLGQVRSLRASQGSGPHRRQQGPHPHGVTLDPSERFLLVPDMGADRVFVYHFDHAGVTLEPATPPWVSVPAGAGPRLILFGASGRYAYLLTELSSEIFTFRWDADIGALTTIDKVTLDPPEQEGERSAAAFVLSPEGRYLYASNRLTNMIHVYAIDRTSGRLTVVQRINCGGLRPWSATFSPDGRWLLVTNQGSGNITAFSAEAASGRLTIASSISVPTPTAAVFAGEIA